MDLPPPADVVVASQRATARLVGVLFIVATVTSIIGGSLLLPLDDQNYLIEVAAHEGQIILGVLLEFILALSVIGIAALLLPVLKPHGEGMAVGYVAVRTVEATFILIASTTALLVLTLSQDWGSAGGVGVEPVGSALLSAREWTFFVGTLIVFGVSAVILNALLYRSRLVPVWLSLLGLVGGLLLLTSAVVEMFAYGVDAPVALQLLGAAPIALQEMILAVLLIWKGFAAPSVAAANGEPGPGYDYVVNLAFYDESGAYLWRCSGTMLSSTVVLTAGHCTFGADSATLWADEGPIEDGNYPFDPVESRPPCTGYTGYPVPARTQRERRTPIPVTTTTPTSRTRVMRESSFSTTVVRTRYLRAAPGGRVPRRTRDQAGTPGQDVYAGRVRPAVGEARRVGSARALHDDGATRHDAEQLDERCEHSTDPGSRSRYGGNLLR